VDSTTLTYAIVTNPGHGTLSGSGNTRTYTPTAGYSGSDSFTFKANDGGLDSNTATVAITINAAQKPIANPQPVTTPEDTLKAITLTGSDPGGKSLTYTIVTTPGHGALSGTAPSVTYTPTANYNGSDSFTFKVNNGSLDSDPATVSLTVTAVTNSPPTAYFTVVTAAPTTLVPVDFSSAGSSDPEGQPLTYSWNFGDGNTSTLANPSHTFYNSQYWSDQNYTITLTVTDNHGASASYSRTITVFKSTGVWR
jgi:hypothetical protein